MLGAVAVLLAVTADGGTGALDPVTHILQNPVVANLGWSTVAIIAVVAIIRGLLVPRSVLIDRMKDKDAVIAEVAKQRDHWETAHGVSEIARTELREQNTALIKAGEAPNKFFDEFRHWLITHPPTQNLRQIEGDDPNGRA